MKTTIWIPFLRREWSSLLLIKLLLLGVFAFCGAFGARAQENIEKEYLSREALLKLVYDRFGKLVTGQNTNTTVTNYASIDPVQGKVALNGALPAKIKRHEEIISILSFKFSGDLLSNNTSILFSNSKLNTNVSLEGEYHIGLNKGVSYGYTGAAKIKKKQSEDQINYQKNIELQKVKLNIEKVQIELKALEVDTSLYVDDIDSLKELTNHCHDLIKVIDHEIKYDESGMLIKSCQKEQKLLLDSISIYNSKIFLKEENKLNAIYKLDSIKYVLSLQGEYENEYIASVENPIGYKYDKKLDSLDMNAEIASFGFSWLTINAGTSRRKYYTFSPGEPFASQIKPEEFYTCKVGLSFNYYYERSLPSSFKVYMNTGFQFQKDNNVLLLSTTKIEEERELVNVGGDTTRTVTKIYNAYTDSIISSNSLALYCNFYLISSSQSIAFHVYPSIKTYDLSKAYINLGIGVLGTFINTKEKEPAVNAELYVQFFDIFNQDGRTQGNLWKNSEIGLRLSHPFNFFK